MARLKITQTKSGIGNKQNQRETLRSLGLKRMHDVVVKEDRPGDPRHGPDRHPPGDGRGGRVSHGETSGPLKVHHLRPAPGAHTKKTRVGRGEGSKGKTAGRGTKGTKARYQVPAGFEGGQLPLHMRLPKLKGFKNRFRVEFQVVNMARLAELFPEGGTVGIDRARRRRRRPQGRAGQGPRQRRPGRRQARDHRQQVLRHRPEKIEAAGGTVTEI